MRSRFAMKLDAAVRQGIVRGLSGVGPFCVVNEYPKSGGSWLGQMLGALLEYDFPRNRMPSPRPSIMHGHYLHPWGIRKVVVIWRDGRDVSVSWYYHCLFKNERENARLVDIVRAELAYDDVSDIRKNLPSFLEYTFTRQRHPRFSWAAFVRQWYGRSGVHFVRYEDLRRDASAELRRLVVNLTGTSPDAGTVDEVVDRFSFARQAGRRPGEENRNSFMRKGIVGDWRNQFTTEARRVFARHAGDALVSLGYEADEGWVDQLGPAETPHPTPG